MKNTEEIPLCAYCLGNKTRPFISVACSEVKEPFSYVQCVDCSLVFLSPRPVKELIYKYYTPTTYWGREIKKRTKQIIIKERKQAYHRIYTYIQKRINIGRILDVGAGTGLFLTKYRDEGWEAIGIEYSREAVRYGKKMYQIDLLQGELSDHVFRQKFDVINLHHTLEHLYDPVITLNQVNKLLAPGGILVVSIPHIGSFGARLFKKDWYGLQPPTHLYHFTEETLRSMLKKCHFTVVSVDYNQFYYNYYCFFESLKKRMSPSGSALHDTTITNNSAPTQGYMKKLAILVAKVGTFICVIIEELFHISEILTVYVQKEN